MPQINIFTCEFGVCMVRKSQKKYQPHMPSHFTPTHTHPTHTQTQANTHIHIHHRTHHSHKHTQDTHNQRTHPQFIHTRIHTPKSLTYFFPDRLAQSPCSCILNRHVSVKPGIFLPKTVDTATELLFLSPRRTFLPRENDDWFHRPIPCKRKKGMSQNSTMQDASCKKITAYLFSLCSKPVYPPHTHILTHAHRKFDLLQKFNNL